MQAAEHPRSLRDERRPVVLAIGSFDGVHRGHQALLARARERALANGGAAWVLTFDPHPLKILKPQSAPLLLTSTAHKLRLLAEQQLDGCIVLPFTERLAAQSPEDFIRFLRENIPTLRLIVVGPNWRFGHRAMGDVQLLERLADRGGFAAEVMPPVSDAHGPISSSRIRRLVSRGELAAAAALLDRPFSIFGTVVHGRHLGRALGFPTANLDPHHEVKPPPGIYATRVRHAQRVYDGAAYLGAPGHGAEVEVHLLTEALDLYGRELEIFFLARIRDDRHFDSTSALQDQIRKDIEEIRRVLATALPVPPR